jgi:hypothetical protein
MFPLSFPAADIDLSLLQNVLLLFIVNDLFNDRDTARDKYYRRRVFSKNAVLAEAVIQ